VTPLLEQGSAGYRSATSPLNSAAHQHPGAVVAATSVDEVADAVRYAAAHGLLVVPQATGHGAAGELGSDVMLLDTAGLDEVEIDTRARTARVGAGATWGAVNGRAWTSGLLGRSGSAPGVGVAGFTFGAGVGWLTRPHGLASGSLTGVDYVDGSGRLRQARDDAGDRMDRDVLWACRGGGGVGIVTALEFGLVAVEELWAGYQLWPISQLAVVVGAWAGALPELRAAVGSSLAVLQAPDGPPFPPELRGQWVVHLATASTGGQDGAAALRGATAGLGAVVDTWGPSDADRLAGIHLDPPVAAPALGDARWLDARAPGIVGDVLAVAAAGSLQMVEVRHVANNAPALPGAMDTAPGGFILHAVGGPGPRTGADLAAIRRAAVDADVGLAVGSWMDGQSDVPDALPGPVRDRVRATADAVDPTATLARSAVLGGAPPTTPRSTGAPRSVESAGGS